MSQRQENITLRLEELATNREANGQKRDVKPMLGRQISEPCFPSTFDPAKALRDPRPTDAAKQLSHEQLALLYLDTLKPLDFYSMLREGRKQSL